MKKYLILSLGYDVLVERVFTEKEFLAATLEHYMIIYDNDYEEASQEQELRLYYASMRELMEEPPYEDYQYGSVWWEQ